MSNPVKSLGYINATALVAPDLLKVQANVSDTTVRRSSVDRGNLKPYWKSEKRPYFSSWLTILLFSIFSKTLLTTEGSFHVKWSKDFPGDPSIVSSFMDILFKSMRNDKAENFRSFAQLVLNISQFENWQVRQIFPLRWGKWDYVDFWGAAIWHIWIFRILIQTKNTLGKENFEKFKISENS